MALGEHTNGFSNSVPRTGSNKLALSKSGKEFEMSVIGVIGLGYVGITTAVGMAGLGHRVIGYDINQNRVQTLSAGTAPIHEIGLEGELQDLLAN